MGFLSDLISNPVGALTGTTAARRQNNQATTAANQQLTDSLGAAQGYLAPYNAAGSGVLASLLAAVGNGTLAPGYASGFDPNAYAFAPTGLPAPGSPDINQALPDPGFAAPVTPFTSGGFDYTADPGYQFRLQQGLDAVQHGAAAGGKALSGQTLKALNDYAQGTAAQAYQDAYGRALGENQLAYDRALGENQLGYQRGLDLSNTQYGRAADTFGRALTLNDLLYGRQQAQNQTAYDRALTQDQRQQDQFYTNDANLYGRLSDLLRLGYGAAGDLAGLASGTGIRQAGNTADAGQFAGSTTYAGYGRAIQQAPGILAALFGG